MAPGTRTVRIMHRARACERMRSAWRNKPRARMPPNGRNCAPPLPPLSLLLALSGSAAGLMHVRVRRYSKTRARAQSTGARAGGRTRARVNVPRGSPVSFFPPLFSREYRFSGLSLSLFPSFSHSRSALFQLLVVGGALHAREHAPLAFSPFYIKETRGTREDRESNARSNARGLCVLCAHWALAVCTKRNFCPRHTRAAEKRNENGDVPPSPRCRRSRDYACRPR